jgi:flagellar hook-length control protein FliK
VQSSDPGDLDDADKTVDTANQTPGAQAAGKVAASAAAKSATKSTDTATVATADSTADKPTASAAPATVSLDAPNLIAASTMSSSTNSTPTANPVNHAAAAQNASSASPTARFAEANHANIVTSVRTALLPKGGTMQLRLDPPELGALQVSVDVRNGVVNATFQTSNDDATKLLSHSLGQLKTALEAQGVSVEKIQVQQTPKDQKSQNDSNGQSQDDRSQQQQQSDQDRRENLRKMWRRVSGKGDPLDLVA